MGGLDHLSGQRDVDLRTKMQGTPAQKEELMSKTFGVSLFALLIAGSARADSIGDVFYIALENHNFTQFEAPPPEQLLGNRAAPFLNSLLKAGNGSYASNYQNVSPNLHPSEPNYVYQVAGVTGPLNDNDPYPNNIVNAPNLGQLLAAKGISWRSYQEDTDLVNTNGNNINGDHGVAPTNTVVPKSQYEVPLTSFSGTSPTYTNPYNGSHQYSYAPEHNPFVFFTATNGGNNPTATNPQAQNYAPLQQLFGDDGDLAKNTVARFNWITPDHYNDMHSSLSGGFTYHDVHYTGDQAAVAEGDNFLSKVVPEIEASRAFKDNGVIVIWNDETEGDKGVGSTVGFTSTEIIISPLAKGNAHTNTLYYTHASDLRTWQNVLGVASGGYLGGAADATDLSDLFKPGVIPSAIPETSTWAMMLIGFGALAAAATFCGRSRAATRLLAAR
jgi:hypothetical protein